MRPMYCSMAEHTLIGRTFHCNYLFLRCCHFAEHENKARLSLVYFDLNLDKLRFNCNDSFFFQLDVSCFFISYLLNC